MASRSACIVLVAACSIASLLSIVRLKQSRAAAASDVRSLGEATRLAQYLVSNTHEAGNLSPVEMADAALAKCGLGPDTISELTTQDLSESEGKSSAWRVYRTRVRFAGVFQDQILVIIDSLEASNAKTSVHRVDIESQLRDASCSGASECPGKLNVVMSYDTLVRVDGGD